MKRLLFIVALMATVFTACQKEEVVIEDTPIIKEMGLKSAQATSEANWEVMYDMTRAGAGEIIHYDITDDVATSKNIPVRPSLEYLKLNNVYYSQAGKYVRLDQADASQANYQFDQMRMHNDAQRWQPYYGYATSGKGHLFEYQYNSSRYSTCIHDELFWTPYSTGTYFHDMFVPVILDMKAKYHPFADAEYQIPEEVWSCTIDRENAGDPYLIDYAGDDSYTVTWYGDLITNAGTFQLTPEETLELRNHYKYPGFPVQSGYYVTPLSTNGVLFEVYDPNYFEEYRGYRAFSEAEFQDASVNSRLISFMEEMHLKYVGFKHHIIYQCIYDQPTPEGVASWEISTTTNDNGTEMVNFSMKRSSGYSHGGTIPLISLDYEDILTLKNYLVDCESCVIDLVYNGPEQAALSDPQIQFGYSLKEPNEPGGNTYQMWRYCQVYLGYSSIHYENVSDIVFNYDDKMTNIFNKYADIADPEISVPLVY